MITGASSGLGLEIARILAKDEHANLVITARRTERLEQLKQELEKQTQIQVKIIPADLGNPDDVTRLFDQAIQGREIFALINNAGVTYYGKSQVDQLPTFDTIIQVNLSALVHLTLRFLDYFQQRGEGAILNITSEAAFVPIPYQNVYAASKHAAQAFTEGLIMEYKDSPVMISSFAPGGIATEMLSKSGLDKKHSADSPFNMKADKVARLAVCSFKRKKYLTVPGIINKATLFFNRFFSRKFLTRAAEKIYHPPAK